MSTLDACTPLSVTCKAISVVDWLQLNWVTVMGMGDGGVEEADGRFKRDKSLADGVLGVDESAENATGVKESLKGLLRMLMEELDANVRDAHDSQLLLVKEIERLNAGGLASNEDCKLLVTLLISIIFEPMFHTDRRMCSIACARVLCLFYFAHLFQPLCSIFIHFHSYRLSFIFTLGF